MCARVGVGRAAPVVGSVFALSQWQWQWCWPAAVLAVLLAPASGVRVAARVRALITPASPATAPLPQPVETQWVLTPSVGGNLNWDSSCEDMATVRAASTTVAHTSTAAAPHLLWESD
jgi:hypothetical protein